jgi:hypothetical protein
MTCALGTLANQASTTIEIVVRPGSVGTLTNRVDVSADQSDPKSSNNSATTGTTVLAPTILWTSMDPRAVPQTQTAPVNLHVVTRGITGVTIALSDGSSLPMTNVGADTFEASLSPAQVLRGYQMGWGHNFVGYLDAYVGATRIMRGNLFVNVLDVTTPPVSVTNVAPDLQMSPHVANIRMDSLCLGCSPSTSLLKRFYSLFPDRYDFVAVVEQVSSFRNRFYVRVRNDTRGLGLSLFDNGSLYGSASRLQGIIKYPIDDFFDLGETSALHEIGHRWGVFSNLGILTPGRPHWPVSDLAFGVMGYSLAGGQGGQFPWKLTEIEPDVYRCDFERPKAYNDLELYLMGLVSENEVSEHFVFRDQSTDCRGGTVTGPVDRFTVADLVNVDGPRVPSVATSQKDFRIATIVLSKDRLLSDTEMAFFDNMAARAAATTELTFASGFYRGTTLPFYLATGKRATLSSELLPP